MLPTADVFAPHPSLFSQRELTYFINISLHLFATPKLISCVLQSRFSWAPFLLHWHSQTLSASSPILPSHIKFSVGLDTVYTVQYYLFPMKTPRIPPNNYLEYKMSWTVNNGATVWCEREKKLMLKSQQCNYIVQSVTTNKHVRRFQMSQLAENTNLNLLLFRQSVSVFVLAKKRNVTS